MRFRCIRRILRQRTARSLIGSSYIFTWRQHWSTTVVWYFILVYQPGQVEMVVSPTLTWTMDLCTSPLVNLSVSIIPLSPLFWGSFVRFRSYSFVCFFLWLLFAIAILFSNCLLGCSFVRLFDCFICSLVWLLIRLFFSCPIFVFPSILSFFLFTIDTDVHVHREREEKKRKEKEACAVIKGMTGPEISSSQVGGKRKRGEWKINNDSRRTTSYTAPCSLGRDSAGTLVMFFSWTCEGKGTPQGVYHTRSFSLQIACSRQQLAFLGTTATPSPQTETAYSCLSYVCIWNTEAFCCWWFKSVFSNIYHLLLCEIWCPFFWG